jgi:hypothetical protein
MSDLRAIADRRFEEALRSRGARDPREFYRERLRELRESSAEGYRRAAEYFEQVLVPEVAREGSDPLGAWLEYGRVLANLQAAGETVQIDPTGRGSPYQPPVPLDHLVLHLPTSARLPALAVGIPTTLSPAQRVTYDLLVRRKTG